ncbi:type IV toxin-antitoxin system AbiEi family antitoxin domain-containing protein [Pseudomonas sp. TWR3-1-1]|uniref:type IV toxin-antitoxin system AbiEi family antitoxin domain-containing protein n=1 Tax=Pseudomonas sp. TWR3-1-1 TaxID=2804633 RepID=UPI003CE9A52C
MILLEEALMAWVLNEYPYSVITKEKLSEQIYLFYLRKEYNGEKIGTIRKAQASPTEYKNSIGKLERSGVIVSIGEVSRSDLYGADYLNNSYIISGKREYSAQETVCTIYPYAYLSKISAMEWYGITDKIPKVIRITSCSPTLWRTKSLADLRIENSPFLEPMHFIPKYPKNANISGKEIIVSTETDYIEPVTVRNSPVKVSSIGKTFIDMLRAPSECGGIDHVIDTYIEYGKKYSSAIIKSLKDHGRKIDIARTGFALQKISGVDHPQLTEWQLESQRSRGSSKILVPGEPFSSIFDADWSLSLNAEIAQQYGN